MKALFIAYYYPPCNSVGVKRAYNFTKHMAANGIKATVLAASPENYVSRSETYGIPPQVSLVRIGSPLPKQFTYGVRKRFNVGLNSELKRNRGRFARLLSVFRNVLMIPDSQIYWAVKCYLVLMLNRGRVEKPDVIFATADPYTDFILAVWLKRLYKCKLVLDYRDPWTQYFSRTRKNESGWRKTIEYKLEKWCLANTDAVIATTSPMLEYVKNASGIPRLHQVIYNGYDQDAFKDVNPVSSKEFVITYTGRVGLPIYDIRPFLRGLKKALPQLKKSGIAPRLNLIGPFEAPEADGYIDTNGLREIITVHGMKPHKECISHVLGSNILLIIMTKGMSETMIISSKVFEYMYADKNIIAVVSENCLTAEILADYPKAYIVDQDDTDGIARLLVSLSKQTDDNASQGFDADKYSRESQARELAKIFRTI